MGGIFIGQRPKASGAVRLRSKHNMRARRKWRSSSRPTGRKTYFRHVSYGFGRRPTLRSLPSSWTVVLSPPFFFFFFSPPPEPLIINVTTIKCSSSRVSARTLSVCTARTSICAASKIGSVFFFLSFLSRIAIIQICRNADTSIICRDAKASILLCRTSRRRPRPRRKDIMISGFYDGKRLVSEWRTLAAR